MDHKINHINEKYHFKVRVYPSYPQFQTSSWIIFAMSKEGNVYQNIKRSKMLDSKDNEL